LRGIADLKPLAGLPLTLLSCNNTPVTDLAPLRGMKLTTFTFSGGQAVDGSVLRGMPLISLDLSYTKLKDYTFLRDCPTLARVDLQPMKFTAAEIAALQAALPNCKIEWTEPAKAAAPRPSPPTATPETAAPAKE
jgi:hypothetical protein